MYFTFTVAVHQEFYMTFGSCFNPNMLSGIWTQDIGFASTVSQAIERKWHMLISENCDGSCASVWNVYSHKRLTITANSCMAHDAVSVSHIVTPTV